MPDRMRVPVLFNGDFSKGPAGYIEMSSELADIYSSEAAYHLVMNPILRRTPGKNIPEVIAFGVYPVPAEPKVEKKKRGRPKKVK